VHQSGAAQVYWHSTWRSAAVTAFAPSFGLPTSIPISTAPEWEERPSGVWWNLPAAQRAVAAGRRLVWTDDDLPVFADQAADLGANPDALLLGPDPELGLSPADLARIGEFIGL
jgi:predicted cobalt transporter CbtA